MKKLTICITTHCVKTETEGLYKGHPNRCPSMPSTRMIESILSDLFTKIDLSISECDIKIGFDKRRGRNIDDEYEKNLFLLCQQLGGQLIVNESDVDDPIITAPKNFCNLLNSVETEYYFLLEHDWIFTRPVPFKSILEELEINDNINLIKFSQQDSVLNSALHNEVTDCSSEFILSLKPSNNIPLLYMCHYSNNPHICRTKVFQNWWTYLVYPTRDWGGFVEGPMNLFFQEHARRVGWENTMKIFKCCVYGQPNDPKWIHHLNGNSWG